MKWALIALVCTGCVSKAETDNYGKPFAVWVPNHVRAFVVDAQACTHFSGEEPYDEKRRAFLEKALRNSCDDLDERKQRLIRRYRSSAEVVALIAEASSE